MPQLFPNAIKYFDDFKKARREAYDTAWEDLNPRHPKGYGYNQVDEDDRESLYASIKDLRYYFGGEMRELLVPEEHPTPQRAVASILAYRDYVKRDLDLIEAMAARYPAGHKQPPPITYILGYEQDVIDMLDHLLNMEEVRKYVPPDLPVMPLNTDRKLYCVTQAEDRDVIGEDPHFGVDHDLLLLMGQKFRSGGGRVQHNGRTYNVNAETFVVFEVDPRVVGSTQEAIRDFFMTKAKERTRVLIYRCRESLLREFGTDVTLQTLKQVETMGHEQDIGNGRGQGLSSFDFWSLMHPRVVEVSRRLFEDGHRKQAVQEAYIALESRVRDYFEQARGEKKYGTALMSAAFARNNPVIRLFPNTDQHHEEKQEGYMHIFMGVMLAIRNPKSHSNFDVGEVDAIEMLFFASRLFKKIETAVRP